MESPHIYRSYDQIPSLWASFNALTRQTYGFDFLEWHRLGLWTPRYTPHSIVVEDQVVANVSTSEMLFLRGDTVRCATQVGTVMTHPAHRGKGYSRKLLENVLEQAGKLPVYLFANASVLDFYPKFGFRPAPQLQPVRPFSPAPEKAAAIELDPHLPSHWELLKRLAAEHAATARLSMVKNPALVLFHCLMNPGGLFYLPELDTVALAKQNGEALLLMDYLSPKLQSPLEVAQAVAHLQTTSLRLGFTPLDLGGWSLERVGGEDTLFVRGESLLQEEELFSLLSHT